MITQGTTHVEVITNIGKIGLDDDSYGMFVFCAGVNDNV